MSTTTRPELRACPACRLVHPSRSALRRHEALDHRPAPDGAHLVALIVGDARSGGLPAAEDRVDRAGATAGAPAPELAALRWAPVLALLCVAAATAALGPLGVLLAAVTSVHWARWQVLRRLDRTGPAPEGDRSSAD